MNAKINLDIQEDFNHLVQNTSVTLIRDNRLKNLIEDVLRRLANNSRPKTICAIFDTYNGKIKLINGLVKDYISESLDSQVTYLITADKSEMEEVMNDLTMNVEVMSMSRAWWQGLKISSIVLSSVDYINCLMNLRTHSVLYPDVVVLVLSSINQLGDENIQLFLRLASESYIDENFFLVFNNAEPETSTDRKSWKTSNGVDIESVLDSTKFVPKNRIFKVSTAKHCCAQDFDLKKADENSNTFGFFRRELEIELDINKATQRSMMNVLQVFQSLNDIANTFEKEEVIITIHEYNCKLEEQSENVIIKIDNYEKKASKETLDTMKEKITKQDNCDIKLVQPLFEKTYVNITEEIGKDLMTINSNANNVGAMAKDMFYKMSNKEVKIKIPPLIEKNFNTIVWQELQTQIENENLSNKPMVDELTKSIDKTNKEIFSFSKDVFLKLKKDFKPKAEKSVEKLKSTIDANVKSYREKIWTEEIDSYFKELKCLLNHHMDRIRQKLEDIFENIISIIETKESINIFPEFIRSSISDQMEEIKLPLEMGKIKEKISSHLASAPITEYNKSFFQPFLDRLSNFTKMNEIITRYEKSVNECLTDLDSDKFYTDQPNYNRIRRLSEGFIRMFSRLRILGWIFVKTGYRFIRKQEIENAIESLHEKLNSYVEEINEEYCTVIEDLVKSGRLI